jgi:hypothetical protein
MLTASRKLVGDLQLRTTIGPRADTSVKCSISPFSLQQLFPVWKLRTHLLYVFLLPGSPVSLVHLFGALLLAFFAPNGLQQAP